VYKEEEFYALANEFFKTVVTEAQTMASEDGSKNIKMHSKTVSWVKRAAGLQRPYDPLEHAAYMSESDEGETDAEDAGPRRLTRGMARNTRVKRREERCQKETEGLRALSDAIEGLEKERGEPFPESRRFVSSTKTLTICLVLLLRAVFLITQVCLFLFYSDVYRLAVETNHPLQTTGWTTSLETTKAMTTKAMTASTYNMHAPILFLLPDRN
jgi:hypothetical protein